MLPVAAHVPVDGSYNSALLKVILPSVPPDTSTWPDGRSVAVLKMRAVWRLPVAVHVPVAGSYNSALFWKKSPPATSTRPEGSKVAMGQKRVVPMLPVLLQLLIAGS
jgi:hypothetical protein